MTRKTVLQLWDEANQRIELVSAQQLAEEIDFGAKVGFTSPMPLVTFRTPPISLSSTLSEG